MGETIGCVGVPLAALGVQFVVLHYLISLGLFLVIVVVEVVMDVILVLHQPFGLYIKLTYQTCTFGIIGESLN